MTKIILFIIRDSHCDPVRNIYWNSFSNESKVWLIILSHETAIYQSDLPKPPVMQFRTFLPLGQLTVGARFWWDTLPWLETILKLMQSSDWLKISKLQFDKLNNGLRRDLFFCIIMKTRLRNVLIIELSMLSLPRIGPF